MSEPKTTTLNKIRDCKPCADGWAKLLKHLGKTEADNEPLLMSTILKSNGFNDALWCLRVFHADYRQTVIDFACDCAQRVLPIWEEWAEKNVPERLTVPRIAIEAAQRDAADAAYAVAYAAHAAAAARAAHAADAADAAGAAAYAAYAAGAAAYAAYAAARAARAAACAAEQSEQKKLLIKYFG